MDVRIQWVRGIRAVVDAVAVLARHKKLQALELLEFLLDGAECQAGPALKLPHVEFLGGYPEQETEDLGACAR